MEKQLQELWQWYQTPMGQDVYRSENLLLNRFLIQCFGYYLVQLGGASNLQWLEASPIRYKSLLTNCTQIKEPNIEIIYGDCGALPFAKESIDVLVLPHTLEFCPDIFETLAEVSHVLRPDGYIILLHFNHWSLWGLSQKFKTRHMPLTGRSLSLSQMRQYLNKIDCVIDDYQTTYFTYSPAENLRKEVFMNFLAEMIWPMGGGIYGILARKQVASLTPLRFAWQKMLSMPKTNLAEPSTKAL